MSFSKSVVGLILACLGSGPAEAQTSPAIVITHIPSFGDGNGAIQGRIATANPLNYKVAGFLFVSGLGYYSKPTCAQTTTAPGADGSFSLDVTTGGLDAYAQEYTLFVVDKSAPVACYEAVTAPPDAVERIAAAKLAIPRPDPNRREISFDGKRWIVKSSPLPVSPGPNYFSDSAENVFVDPQGRLHMQITFADGHWNSAEVISKEPVGFGRYDVQVESSPELDPNVVFGSFTYADAQPRTREIDMPEFGDFGRSNDPTNAQFVVWAADGSLHLDRFTLPPAGPFEFQTNWSASAVDFGARDTQGSTLRTWSYAGDVPDDGADATRYRLNLWLFGGQPPSNGRPAEVVVRSANLPTKPLQRLVALAPATGGGISQTFTAVFRHSEGASGHYLGYLLILPTPNIVWFTAQGSCLVEYNRISNGMRLINDAGSGWLGPPQGVAISPLARPLSNSQCSVDVAHSSALLAGDDMIVTVALTLRAADPMTQVLGTFTQELDVHGNWTDMRQFGNWVLPAAPRRAGPSIDSFAPAQVSGSSATYTAVVSDTSGANRLAAVHLLIGSKIVDEAPCQAIYFPLQGGLNLINDDGTALVAPSPVALGSAQPLSNSRCTVDVAGASASANGNAITLTAPVSFNTARFHGPKNVYLNAFDVDGKLTHWVQTGTVVIQ